ncbi:MAG: hypothetical protein J6J65_03265 [Opitutales bacterium]|nr:hypothetical protein [Opitutales bacterium]
MPARKRARQCGKFHGKIRMPPRGNARRAVFAHSPVPPRGGAHFITAAARAERAHAAAQYAHTQKVLDYLRHFGKEKYSFNNALQPPYAY